MDNFNLRKYLAEGKLLKENREGKSTQGNYANKWNPDLNDSPGNSSKIDNEESNKKSMYKRHFTKAIHDYNMGTHTTDVAAFEWFYSQIFRTEIPMEEGANTTSNGIEVSTTEDGEEITVSMWMDKEYTGTINDGSTLFIHYYGDGEYHNENDVPTIFKKMEELGGNLDWGDDEASIKIDINKLI